MKVLCSSVLTMEAIIVLLAAVMATSGDPAANLAPFIAGIVLSVILAMSVGMLRRPWGVRLGWVMQVLALAYGIVLGIAVNAVYGVTLLIVLAIFVSLWWVAVRVGRAAEGRG